MYIYTYMFIYIYTCIHTYILGAPSSAQGRLCSQRASDRGSGQGTAPECGGGDLCAWCMDRYSGAYIYDVLMYTYTHRCGTRMWRRRPLWTSISFSPSSTCWASTAGTFRSLSRRWNRCRTTSVYIYISIHIHIYIYIYIYAYTYTCVYIEEVPIYLSIYLSIYI